LKFAKSLLLVVLLAQAGGFANQYAVVPIASYSTETKGQMGVFGVYMPSKDVEYPLAWVLSQRKQSKIRFKPEWRREHDESTLWISAEYWPYTNYSQIEPIVYTSKTLELGMQYYRRGAKWNPGFVIEYMGEFAQSPNKYHQLSTGLCVKNDTRNSPEWAHTGNLFTACASTVIHNPKQGELNLNNAYFRRAHGQIIWAQHYSLALQTSPFPYRNRLNSEGVRLLRGYEAGRYRGDLLLAMQQELRTKLFWRLAGVIFADVAYLKDFQAAEVWLYSFGFGGRYNLKKSETYHLRGDFAYTKQGIKLTVYLKEAF
jgi:hypothetical protein